MLTQNNRGEEEAPRAFVVPAPGATATKQDIFDFVSQRVSKIKWLTGGVAFVDSIPKAPVSAGFGDNPPKMTMR